MPLLRARSGPGPFFADDRLAKRDELVSGESVHDQLLCDGSSGVPLMRVGGTDDSSGTPMLESFISGFVADMTGELPACVVGPLNLLVSPILRRHPDLVTCSILLVLVVHALIT